MIELQHLAKPKDGPAPRWFHVAVAASMIISAVSALVATLHTGKAMGALVEQNARLVRAQSTPMLEFVHGNERGDGSARLEFTVQNVGTGLARMVWFELKVDDRPMKTMAEAINAVSPGPKADLSYDWGAVASRVVAAGSEIRLFGWAKPDAGNAQLLQAWNALDKARLSRIKVQACYCSVFDECWTSQLNGDLPVSVPNCKSQSGITLRG